jgi:hypothetical protein
MRITIVSALTIAGLAAACGGISPQPARAGAAAPVPSAVAVPADAAACASMDTSGLDLEQQDLLRDQCRP